jgi:hypothetical protein
MPVQPFGKADPHYDALRIWSNQALGSDPGGSGTIGSGLLNHIYLWQADGSSLLDFQPDALGLSDALVAVRSGGSIIIPSMTIDLTAAITIPVGVMVYGLSRENTILSFTTLSSATAIALSARGVLEHLTVTVAGTQPLIGVDARAARASVREVTVNMASHASNIKIYAGYPESP